MCNSILYTVYSLVVFIVRDYFKSDQYNPLANSIAQQLFEQILLGELKPNEKIVETTYAEKFNLSRSPVREAFYLLGTEGIIDRIPRKGAYVREYSEVEIQDLLDVRNQMEYMAAEKIENPSSNEKLLEKMKTITEQMAVCEDIIEYTHLNFAFHSILIEFSGSTIIRDVYDKISLRLMRIQAIHFELSESLAKSISEHQELYEALKVGDMELFKQLLRAHTGGVIINLRKYKSGVYI